MFCTRKVNDDYTWVGADGRRLAMFEGVYDVPRGISFNSYLLMDGKTVLFDTADAPCAAAFWKTWPTGWEAGLWIIWWCSIWSRTTPLTSGTC